jgi:glycerophosphoryl diester phosphodiesterase
MLFISFHKQINLTFYIVLTYSKETSLSQQTNTCQYFFLQAVKSAGQKLYVWTVDYSNEAIWLDGLGVNGIITNRPGWLRDLL